MGIIRGKPRSSERERQVDVMVGHRIRAARGLRGISQSTLGSAIGITFQQIMKMERAINRTTVSRLVSIADAVQLPVSFFFEEVEREGRRPSRNRRGAGARRPDRQAAGADAEDGCGVGGAVRGAVGREGPFRGGRRSLPLGKRQCFAERNPMKFDIRNLFTGAVQFTAEIDCAEDATTPVKIGLAVKWGFARGASLVGASLVGASLDGARLDGASLDGARLDGARLVGASLVGASLDGASLDGARLDGASLDGASLDGASLVGASLVGASLDGASLDGARLDEFTVDGKIGIIAAGSPNNWYAWGYVDREESIAAGTRGVPAQGDR